MKKAVLNDDESWARAGRGEIDHEDRRDDD